MGISQAHRSPFGPGFKPVRLTPAGALRSEIRDAGDDCWAGLAALIALDPVRFSPESTRGRDEFPHVEVLFVFHRVAENSVFESVRHPRDRKDWPMAGIFAERAKARPNRNGATVHRLERVEGTRI